MAGELLNSNLNIFDGLLSTDNEVRSAAEKAYENIPLPTKLALLMQAIPMAELPPQARTLSAILLRRVFIASFDDLWPNLSPDIQQSVKTQLLLAVKNEKDESVCHKICDAVAELLRDLTGKEDYNWPEALKFLFDMAGSEDVSQKLSALHIFRCVPGMFGDHQAQYIEVIKQMLMSNLKVPDQPKVQCSAVQAICAFLQENDKSPEVLGLFRDTLPFMIQIIAKTIQEQTDDTLLQCLVELAENTPKFLRPQLENIIEICIKVIGDKNFGDQWRQMSTEVIVTLSETASAMLRKHGRFMPTLVPLLLEMMVELEEDAEWAIKDDSEDEDTDSNAIMAESSLDRLACGIGGKTMLPHILQNVPPMLQKDEWKYRHAALMAISACGEGCHQQMESLLPSIVDAVLPFMKDRHPRVQYAACNAIGQMCTDFGPLFQKKFHLKVCPALLDTMNDDTYPRVQAHASAALVNFSEDCPKYILSLFLSAIIQCLQDIITRKLKELLEKGTKTVLEQVVTTVASVADTAEEKFTEHYDKFMPQLKYILQHAVHPELRTLRGKTIECVSLIALAVGKDKFLPDCHDVMNLLLKTQTDSTDLADDDPQVSYTMSAWARMCKVLGKDFEQFLPVVMGPVLKAANHTPEVTVIDSDEAKGMEGDSDWQFVTLGDQQSFGIRTAGLEDKATACHMLVCYARELKDAFVSYAEEVVKIMVPLLKFYFHEDVRTSATESLPHLLECVAIRGQQYVSDMWNYICPSLLLAIDSEPEKSVLSEQLHCMAKCISYLGVGCLSEEHMGKLLKTLDSTLNTHFERQELRQAQRVDEDYDEVMEEDLTNEDDEDIYILSKVADVMHSLFLVYKEEFLPTFRSSLAAHFVKLLGAERPWPDRHWSLCVWCEVLEFTGPHSFQISDLFLKRMMDSTCDSQAEVRQAACYGIGVMGKFGSAVYASHCSESLPLLLHVIRQPGSRSEENESATENAIAAITKILKHNNTSLNIDDILQEWLTWLPVWEDEEEAIWIYGYLCDLIEINHPLIIGQQNSNLPRLLGIIGEIFCRETVAGDEILTGRLLSIVRQVKANEAMFQACLSQLSQNQQVALCAALEPNHPR